MFAIWIKSSEHGKNRNRDTSSVHLTSGTGTYADSPRGMEYQRGDREEREDPEQGRGDPLHNSGSLDLVLLKLRRGKGQV